MIDDILIRNFQSHKRTELKLSKGVNVLVGSSDQGKSAVIRALRWLVFNRPKGSSFKSWWGGPTIVRVRLMDGTRVRRVKGKKNLYQLSLKGHKPESLKGFGQGVPHQIADVLNFGELNWRLQMDAPFLLSSSGGEIARRINRIVHLDDIDKVHANLNAQRLANSQEQQAAEISLREAKDELKSMERLDELQPQIDKVRKLDSKITKQRNDYERLKRLLENYKRSRKEVEELSVVCSEDVCAHVNEASETVVRLRRTYVEAKRLRFLLRDMKDAKSRLDECEPMLSHSVGVKQLSTLLKTCKEEIEKHRRLKAFIVDMKARKKDVIEYGKEIEKYELQLPKTCPTCGAKIK